MQLTLFKERSRRINTSSSSSSKIHYGYTQLLVYTLQNDGGNSGMSNIKCVQHPVVVPTKMQNDMDRTKIYTFERMIQVVVAQPII
jgi:hypothetical protein